MLRAILDLIQIRKELPDIVGYRTVGPYDFPIPEELKELLIDKDMSSLEGLSIFYLEIDNLSSKVQKDFRVVYSGDFHYLPKINSESADSSPQLEVKREIKELRLSELLPNKSISISFFNTNENFDIKQVIVGEQLVTLTMNKLVELKKVPPPIRLYLFMALTLAISITGVLSSVSILNNNLETNRLMTESFKELGYVQCTPELYENHIGEESALERKFKQLSEKQQTYTLTLNHVLSYEELSHKDKVLFCNSNAS